MSDCPLPSALEDEQRRAEKSRLLAQSRPRAAQRGRAAANDSRAITQKRQEQGEARHRTERTAQDRKDSNTGKPRQAAK